MPARHRDLAGGFPVRITAYSLLWRVCALNGVGTGESCRRGAADANGAIQRAGSRDADRA